LVTERQKTAQNGLPLQNKGREGKKKKKQQLSASESRKTKRKMGNHKITRNSNSEDRCAQQRSSETQKHKHTEY
jgi:hypothetical protein